MTTPYMIEQLHIYDKLYKLTNKIIKLNEELDQLDMRLDAIDIIDCNQLLFAKDRIVRLVNFMELNIEYNRNSIYNKKIYKKGKNIKYIAK